MILNSRLESSLTTQPLCGTVIRTPGKKIRVVNSEEAHGVVVGCALDLAVGSVLGHQRPRSGVHPRRADPVSRRSSLGAVAFDGISGLASRLKLSAPLRQRVHHPLPNVPGRTSSFLPLPRTRRNREAPSAAGREERWQRASSVEQGGCVRMDVRRHVEYQ
jgi:hypothetical protein